MGRKPKFTEDDFLRAALNLAAEHGPDKVTVAAIAESTGAPIGSLYHRFGSRSRILARLWLRIIADFQEDFISILGHDDPVEAARRVLSSR